MCFRLSTQCIIVSAWGKVRAQDERVLDVVRQTIVSAWGKVRAQDIPYDAYRDFRIVSAWGKVRAQDCNAPLG